MLRAAAEPRVSPDGGVWCYCVCTVQVAIGFLVLGRWVIDFTIDSLYT